jgi:hypothetical protein
MHQKFKGVSKNKNWLNDEICQSRKQRDYYAKISNFSKYKEYRNKTTSLTRKSKTRLFKNAIEKDKNIKYLWNHLKDLISNSTSTQIKEISDEGKTITDLSDICNFLNKHFTSIANKVRTFPSTNYKSETLGSFVKNKVDLPDSEIFCIKTTNEDEVFKLLCSLDPSKSIGPDGIGPKILKIAAPITKSLAYILNQSILSGCFPDQLKEARVTPLFKDGFTDDPNNYRPISVLPTKLFEKVVCSQFYDFLSRFKLLHGKQSGFRILTTNYSGKLSS